MSYNLLATLRLHDGDGGRTMTVGPSRRVVFKNRIGPRMDLRKDEVKAVLRPLAGYWGSDHKIDTQRLGHPFMSHSQFKAAAKVLLKDAGLLMEPVIDDGE